MPSTLRLSLCGSLKSENRRSGAEKKAQECTIKSGGEERSTSYSATSKADNKNSSRSSSFRGASSFMRSIHRVVF